MLYLILGHDVADSLARRKQARPAHIERIKQLQTQGRLVIAGPRPAIDAADPGPAGFVGSLIIAEFDDLTAARDWADADPYVEAGVYSHIDVQPFVKTLP